MASQRKNCVFVSTVSRLRGKTRLESRPSPRSRLADTFVVSYESAKYTNTPGRTGAILRQKTRGVARNFFGGRGAIGGGWISGWGEGGGS